MVLSLLKANTSSSSTHIWGRSWAVTSDFGIKMPHFCYFCYYYPLPNASKHLKTIHYCFVVFSLVISEITSSSAHIFGQSCAVITDFGIKMPHMWPFWLILSPTKNASKHPKILHYCFMVFSLVKPNMTISSIHIWGYSSAVITDFGIKMPYFCYFC